MGKNGEVHFEYFSESRIALLKELREHPMLRVLISAEPNATWEQCLATICTYCSIEIDGMFTPDEFDMLYDKLIHRLILLRKIVVH